MFALFYIFANFLVFFPPPLTHAVVQPMASDVPYGHSLADYRMMRKCYPDQNKTCTRIPLGTVTKDRLAYPRFTCNSEALINYEDANYIYPVLTANFFSYNRSLRIDQGTCIEIWSPSKNKYGLHYNDIWESLDRCVVQHKWGCAECPIGHGVVFRGNPNQNEGIRRCQKLGKMHINNVYLKTRDELKELSRASVRKCEDGWYQVNLTSGCTARCPPNCRLCRDKNYCDQCMSGYQASPRNKHCFKLDEPCPRGFYRTVGECMLCSEKVPNCTTCDEETGTCTECARGLVLTHQRFREICQDFCPRGTYTDLETGNCMKCPPYCTHCLNDTVCLECAEGLFSLQDTQTNSFHCYTECPFGYWSTSTFPFRCLKCHPNCWGCHNGPTHRHCLDCRYYGVVGRRSRIPKCTSKRPMPDEVNPEIFPAKSTNWTENMALAFWMIATPYAETGSQASLCPKHQCSVKQSRIFSNFFKTYQEADEYFNSLNTSLAERYGPVCDGNDCFENCEFEGRLDKTDYRNSTHCVNEMTCLSTLPNFDPCSKCKPGFIKDPFSKKCIDECPHGTLFDRTRKKCFMVPNPTKCRAGEWSLIQYAGDRISVQRNITQLIQQPYNFTYAQYLADITNTLMRVTCLDKVVSKDKCNEEYQFELYDGSCQMCHSECIGCVGFGNTNCLRCRTAYHPNGYCIAKCPPGYSITEDKVGRRICNFMRPTSIEEFTSKHHDVLTFRSEYLAPWWLHVATVLPLAVILLLIQAISLIFTCFEPPRPRFDSEILSWRHEKKARLDEMREFEEIWTANKNAHAAMNKSARIAVAQGGAPATSQPQSQQQHSTKETTVQHVFPSIKAISRGSAERIEMSVRRRNPPSGKHMFVLHRPHQVKKRLAGSNLSRKVPPIKSKSKVRSVDKTQANELFEQLPPLTGSQKKMNSVREVLFTPPMHSFEKPQPQSPRASAEGKVRLVRSAEVTQNKGQVQSLKSGRRALQQPMSGGIKSG
ncbi:unnamed protein product, partial [Mesorhabditis belari]|uniref:Uncharacterized protein n=1 Tax=Mesorhabditis belari TaxID=2138241 RepID=A0AAF3EN34_9BILA